MKARNSDPDAGIRTKLLTPLFILIALSASAQAQSTWNGGGADGNWLTSANWSSVPAANSALTFDGSTRLTNTNNFAAGTAFGLITFASTNNNFFLTGNRITLGNNIVTAGTATQTMAMDLTLNGNRNITNNNTSTLVLSGVINESGGARNLQKVGTGTLVLSNTANTFTGGVQINQGTVQVTKLANLGENSSVGTRAGTSTMRLGQQGTTGTLEYTGTGDTTDLQINIGNADGVGGSTLLNNGSGALVFNHATFNVSGATGTNTAARNLTLGGTNTGANTISGAVANTGSGTNLKTISVIKQDAGTWILSASNAYTGGTTLSNGVLRAGNNNAFGTGAFTLSGGTLASDGATARTFTNAVVLTANATLAETNVGTGNLTLSGPVTTTGAASRTLTVNQLATFSGLVDGSSGALFKAGVGTLVLENTANTFSGGFGINQGTVQVTKLADVGANSSVGTRNSNSVMRLGQQGTTGTLEYTGTGDTTDLQITIGNADGVGGSTILNNGSGALVFDHATFNVSGTAGSATNARSLTLGGANTGANTISGVIADTGSGSNLKTISVVKTNAGTWILSGANTYSGTTTVNGGTLVVVQSTFTATITSTNITVALSNTPSVGNTFAILPGPLQGNYGTPTVNPLSTGQTASFDASTGVLSINQTSNGAAIEDAYPGINATNLASNGLTYLVNYAFGGSSVTEAKLPLQDTTDPTKLTLVAYVRTNNSSGTLTVTGEKANALNLWDTNNPILGEPAQDQSDAPSGTEKRIFSTPKSGDRLFLRLKTTLQP